jgi:hypothetical protein
MCVSAGKFIPSLQSLKKGGGSGVGSGSGSISQRYGSAYPDLEPHQKSHESPILVFFFRMSFPEYLPRLSPHPPDVS